MTGFLIRPAAAEDLPRLARLYEAFLSESLAAAPQARPNPDLRAELALAMLMEREPSAMLVAQCEGATAGFAFVEIRPAVEPRRGFAARWVEFVTRRQASLSALIPARGWLGHLYVAPEFRRRGAAEALIRAAADWTRSQGVGALDLNVLASNDAARRLYEKLGMAATLVEYRMTL